MFSTLVQQNVLKKLMPKSLHSSLSHAYFGELTVTDKMTQQSTTKTNVMSYAILFPH